MLFSSMLLLAADPAKGGAAPDGGGSILSTPLVPMLAILFLFMYLFVLRPQGKERARRERLLAAVKKNDRVLTASGIYGVVTNVHREANEVTVRVDEATNAKLRMTLSSIAEVLGDAPPEETAK